MKRADLLDFAWGDAVDRQALRARLDQDGAIVVRSLIDARDVARLREIVGAHLEDGGRRIGLGRVQPNAAAYVSGLEQICLHPNVVALFESVLGEGEIVFTGHCDAHKNLLSDWHKDSGSNGSYFASDCFTAPDCGVYKIGFYLQDHVAYGGLTVRAGSHRARSVRQGQAGYVSSRAGDAVIFDVRLSHRGRTPDGVEFALKALNRLLQRDRERDDPRLAAAEERYLRALGRDDRLSIFFTFGRPNRHTRDFAVANMARQDAQLGCVGQPLPDAFQRRLAASGVKTIDSITGKI